MTATPSPYNYYCYYYYYYNYYCYCWVGRFQRECHSFIKGIVHQLDMYTLYEAVSYTDYHGTCHKLNRLKG